MIDESVFQDRAAETIRDLEDRVLPFSEIHEFEMESGGGMLTLTFEDPSPAKFIISPNGPARQIWVSALSTSYKFDLDQQADDFLLDKTRESFVKVMGRLISQQLGTDVQL
jgi:iron-sulfur cluster assembly protein CyaY